MVGKVGAAKNGVGIFYSKVIKDRRNTLFTYLYSKKISRTTKIVYFSKWRLSYNCLGQIYIFTDTKYIQTYVN